MYKLFFITINIIIIFNSFYIIKADNINFNYNEPYIDNFDLIKNEKLAVICRNRWGIGGFDYAEKKGEPYNYIYNEKKKNILIFNIDLDIFNDFLKNPSEEFLKSILCMDTDKLLVGEMSYDNIYPNADGKSDDFLTYIYPTIVNDKEYYVYGSKMFDYYLNTANVVLRKTLIDYLDIKNIQKILNKKGIDEKVEERAMIEVSYYNLIIWIKTENNIYLLEMKDSWQPQTYDNNELFTVEEFKETFTPKTGKLIIDDVEMQGDNVIFYKDYALIKARPIWEKLSGKEVIWNQYDKSVSFYYNDRKLSLKNNCYYENDEIVFDFRFNPYYSNGSFYWKYKDLEYELKKNYNKYLEVNPKLNLVMIK